MDSNDPLAGNECKGPFNDHIEVNKCSAIQPSNENSQKEEVQSFMRQNTEGFSKALVTTITDADGVEELICRTLKSFHWRDVENGMPTHAKTSSFEVDRVLKKLQTQAIELCASYRVYV
ncbi:hypothetical protein TNCV_4254541 [Trichonephila clavipes]|nr:hypothetical protein TNCV_4254541 [Trichonephila clavipes]